MGERVVVGVDGSAPSVAALRWGARYAAAAGAQLVVLHVWDVPDGFGGLELAAPDLRRDLEQIAAETLDAAVAAARSDAGAGVPVEGELRRGAARVELIEASREADLLVLGNVGHGRLLGVLLGSVADHCVQRAHCPVTVVPVGDGGAP